MSGADDGGDLRLFRQRSGELILSLFDLFEGLSFRSSTGLHESA